MREMGECKPGLGIREAGRNPELPRLDAGMQPVLLLFVCCLGLFVCLFFRKRVIPKELDPKLSEQRMIADFRIETCYYW